MRALERAIAFCQSTLSYGAAQEPAPDRKTVAVEPLIEEVHETLGLGLDVPIRWIVAVERGLTVEADHDQLFRVLVNVARNAVQALEARGARDPARDQIRITGRREGSVVVLEVSDTGPGVSDKARAHLFEAFQGSTRAGGAGLGLAIAAELVRAHGGEMRLVDGTIGATFRITIPDARLRWTPAAAIAPAPEAAERGKCTLNRNYWADGAGPACQCGVKTIAMPRSRSSDFPAAVSAPVAQLDRAPDYESGGRGFEISPGAP